VVEWTHAAAIRPGEHAEKMSTKATRINWKSIKNEARREELKSLAAKMRRLGYARIQLNYHGANKYSIDGFNAVGGTWIG
jgi:hypothetical protein